jgi:DNA (cytosine-5)-methyltransferase 1
MSFNWKWNLSELDSTKKNTYKVFSTFACGGGSTMGYKLAGYTMVGANDVDPKMAMIYKKNHEPKHYFLCDIRELLNQSLPEELYNLDIFDGSPPCTSFSMAGKREKGWGESRKYAEGAVVQTLDDLYFRFIDVAKELQPKIIVSENVTGLVKGNAKIYWKNIIKKFNEAGYDAQTFLLNGATMGVPQKRERVFIIGRRKDLCLPPLVLQFNEKPIMFGKVRSQIGVEPTDHAKKLLANAIRSDKCISDINERMVGKTSGFNAMIVKDEEVCPTIIATGDNFRFADKMQCSKEDYVNCGTFPQDYDFCGVNPKYVIGMSVPPLMIANIAEQIKVQWLDKLST